MTYRCSCGASCKASSNPPSVAARIVQTAREVHAGLGHHEVDAAEHRRILARERRAEAAVVRASR